MLAPACFILSAFGAEAEHIGNERQMRHDKGSSRRMHLTHLGFYFQKVAAVSLPIAIAALISSTIP